LTNGPRREAREDEALLGLADEGMAPPEETISLGARNGPNPAPDPHLAGPQPDE
jgi:hypothetical protein